MKHTRLALFAALLATPALFAQAPTWAEQIHKIKTGVYPPATEQRLNEQKKAREQASQPQLGQLFTMLDHNSDGVISAEEWRAATQPAETSAPGSSR